MTVEGYLRSVGKTTFVKYYFNFQSKSFDYCMTHFEENYTYNSKATKISCAKSIFSNGMEKEALKIIINSDRVDQITRQKARQILLTIQ